LADTGKEFTIKIRKVYPMMVATIAKRFLFFFLTISLTASMVLGDNKEKDRGKISNHDGGNGVNFYPIEKEIALGKQMAQEVERQTRIVDDPVISEYVNRIGQNVVRNSGARVPFTIKVIDDDSINAFTLPGGFFFVNTGILLNAGNEAEMAGVMLHEIGNVAARHETRSASRAENANIKAKPVYVVSRSEFDDVKTRMLAMRNRRKGDSLEDSGRPMF
jgi:predicted Zn-dependent protease